LSNSETIEEYLEKVGLFAESRYGSMVRENFRDIKGSSELAMLAAPTKAEIEQLNKAVAIMTADEKQNADRLTDEQIHRIAEDAKIDSGIFAIFINGYALHCKRLI